MRQQCMETFSDTRKRNEEIGGEPSTSKKRRRRSGDDTISYLRDKMEMDRQMKERELQYAEQRENTMQQILAQQQQQNQAILTLMLSQNK